MYQIAVCDDNLRSLKIISNVTEGFFKKNGESILLEKYSEGIKLKKDIMEGKKFDIIITDIEMPDIHGLDLAASIREIDAEVILIFVTLYEKYAVEGYELSIFRYVPKNMLSKKLPEALSAAKQKIGSQNTDMFMVEKSDETFLLPQKDILYIYREGKNVVIITKCSTVKIRSSLIKTYEKLNLDYFFFVEKGYIVNIEQIYSVQKDTITMKNMICLPISSVHLQETKKKIADYWKGKVNRIC